MTKRGTPPLPKKNLTKTGTGLFADGDVRGLRQINCKYKPAATVVLPGLLQSIQSFFFFPRVHSGRTRVIKS